MAKTSFFPDLTVLRANQSHDETNIRSYIVGTGLSRCDNLFIQTDCYRHDLHNQSLLIIRAETHDIIASDIKSVCKCICWPSMMTIDIRSLRNKKKEK